MTALAAYLTVVCRLPRRVLQDLAEQALGIQLSLGNTQACCEEASEAVTAPCQELNQPLSAEPVLNVDETGWRTNGAKRFVWAFGAARFVVYTIAQTRGSALLIQMLGAVFAGILCSERFCRDALALHARLFRLWHKFNGGQIDRQQLFSHSIPLQRKFFALADANLDNTDRPVQNLAMALFVNAEKLFTFLELDRVEPANDSAERALRTGVQWRKICFGNRSTAGELATARLLTVAQTCRLQQSQLPLLPELGNFPLSQGLVLPLAPCCRRHPLNCYPRSIRFATRCRLVSRVFGNPVYRLKRRDKRGWEPKPSGLFADFAWPQCCEA